jgi:hypothetical protein
MGRQRTFGKTHINENITQVLLNEYYSPLKVQLLPPSVLSQS